MQKRPLIQPLFVAVRKECSAPVWSKGVQLARGDGVLPERATDEEMVFRVVVDGRRINPTVTLWPADQEWSCDCDSKVDPCEHVAATVIAIKQGQQGGPVGQKTEAKPVRYRVGYRLRRQASTLQLVRTLVDLRTAAEKPLGYSLTSIVTGQRAIPLVSSEADLRVEAALGARVSAVIGAAAMPRLLDALSECGDVTLDEQPVKIEAIAPQWRAIVEEHGGGFRVRVEHDAQFDELFQNGAVLSGQTLRPLGDCPLSQAELEQLPRGRRFSEREVGQLVAEFLPDLQSRLPVDVRTQRLPQARRLPLRAAIELRAHGEQLLVSARAVYGEPPSSQIEGGRLVTLDPSAPIPIRDRPGEARVLSQAAAAHDLDMRTCKRLTGDRAIAFVKRVQREHRGPIVGNGLQAFTVRGKLGASLALSEDSFDLSFSLERGPEHRATPEQVLAAFHAGQRFAPLEGGGWAEIPHDFLERCGSELESLISVRQATHSGGKALGGVAPVALPDLLTLCASLDQPLPPKLDALRALVEGLDGVPKAELPGDLTASLRDYQRQGVDWLCMLRSAELGAMLADDMGLGKTLQALCALRGKALIVAPTSVLRNWQNECARFRPSLSVNLFHGNRRQLDPDCDLTLTSYAILRRDIDTLRGRSWATIILDEAQTIRNPASQVARAAFSLAGDFRIALTGTPVENRLTDLWAQFHFLNPGLLGGQADFDERYASPISNGDSKASAALQRKIQPFILRRLKAEVATELPPRTDTQLHCELSESERRVYDAVHAATKSEVIRSVRSGGSVLAALEALLRLRQAACHSALVPGQHATHSSKLNLLLTQLEQVRAEGHRALVFSQWTSLLDLIEPELDQAGLSWTRLDGTTRDRAAVVERYQREDGPTIMLVSLKAGGIGLNLTAADHVYLLDPWWNPAVEEQAADRAHRIGQERPVFVHRLIASGTVEERIVELQQKKRSLANVALEQAAAAASLSRDELLHLLD